MTTVTDKPAFGSVEMYTEMIVESDTMPAPYAYVYGVLRSIVADKFRPDAVKFTHVKNLVLAAGRLTGFDPEPEAVVLGDLYATRPADGPVQIVPHGPVRPPYGSPERAAHDRRTAD